MKFALTLVGAAAATTETGIKMLNKLNSMDQSMENMQNVKVALVKNALVQCAAAGDCSKEAAAMPTLAMQSQVEPQCNDNFARVQQQKHYTLDSSFVTRNTKNGKFVDPSFPANTSSIYNSLQTSGLSADFKVTAMSAVNGTPGIKWMRPSEISKDPSLWGSEGINTKVSEQGALGDCWFLSTASALAAYPDRIKAMFPGQDKYSAIGAFQVRLFIKGEPVNVIVDDQVPIHGTSYWLDKPSKAGALWLVILEKAMAKLNVNYAGLNGGGIGQAMRYMTGMPTNTYFTNTQGIGYTLSDDQIWDLVQHGFSQGYNMGATCLVSNYNMASDHAYGLIGSVVLKGGAKNGQKLIKIRNPWGTHAYNGPWSEKDQNWTADYRKQAGDFGTENIGAFWIPLEDFSQDFKDLVVNYFRPNWKVEKYEGHKMEFGHLPFNQFNTWQTVDNKVKQDVIFECDQYEKRLFPSDTCRDSDKNAPLNFGFQVFDDKAVNLKSLGSMFGHCNGDALMYKDLPAGTYQLQIINYDGSNEGHPTLFTMKTHGQKETVTIKPQVGNTNTYKFD